MTNLADTFEMLVTRLTNVEEKLDRLVNITDCVIKNQTSDFCHLPGIPFKIINRCTDQKWPEYGTIVIESCDFFEYDVATNYLCGRSTPTEFDVFGTNGPEIARLMHNYLCYKCNPDDDTDNEKWTGCYECLSKLVGTHPFTRILTKLLKFMIVEEDGSLEFHVHFDPKKPMHETLLYIAERWKVLGFRDDVKVSIVVSYFDSRCIKFLYILDDLNASYTSHMAADEDLSRMRTFLESIGTAHERSEFVTKIIKLLRQQSDHYLIVRHCLKDISRLIHDVHSMASSI